MGRFLTQNTPIFASLQSIINGNHEFNKTVFAVSKYEEKIEKAVALVRKTMNDFNNPDSGFVFVMPAIHAYGFAKPLEEEV